MFDPTAGSIVWSIDLGVPGWYACVTADLDGDGVHEIVFESLDEVSFEPWLRILDGRDGAALAEVAVPVHGEPVIADVDGDGSAEIVLGGGDWVTTKASVVILGHPEDGWQPTTPNWYGHDHSDVNVDPDGEVVANPEPRLGTGGAYRGHRRSWGAGVDLAVSVVDDCVFSCEEGGEVKISTAVANLGGRNAEIKPDVALYAERDGIRTLLDTHVTWWKPRLGTSEPGPTFTVSVSAVKGAELVLVVDPDDEQPECDEANEVRFRIAACD